MKIDAHSHFIPDDLIDLMRKESKRVNTEIVTKEGREFISHNEGFAYPLFDEFFDYDTKVRDMEEEGFDKVVLSVAPSVYYYWLPGDAGIETARLCNDWVCAFRKEHPDRFEAMATLPMQNQKASLKELERAKVDLGLNAVEIAPVILGKSLDDPEYDAFFALAEELNILVYLHPYYIGIKPPFDKYYETNILANLIETTRGISRLILGGIFEKYPKLKVLTSHAGGFFPYQMGRFMHGYDVRPEPKEKISKSPENYINNLYYDCITHWVPALKFLVENFGADHVVLGTDYPYDMGDFNPIPKVEALGLNETDSNKIFSENIIDLLKG